MAGGIGETMFKDTLRMMAWERAKGELQSMLHTYWQDNERFDEMDVLVIRFVEEVEKRLP